MNQKLKRWTSVAALAIAGVIPLSACLTHAVQTTTAPAVAGNDEIDDLRVQAFSAVRVGDFGKGDDLLSRAAKLSNDPTLVKMHAWTNQFEDQLKIFTDERHQAYEKAVAEVKKLSDNGHEDAALDLANRAQSLSDDKKAFHDIGWVRVLIADSIKHAGQYETDDVWYRAMRIYADLVAVDPASREWKEKLKTATRRVRLLAAFAPDSLKAIQERESKERDEVDALLDPTTRPTTKPADPLARNENFKTDWHDSLRGIKLSMLVTAMHDASNQYYREVNYRGLMDGGLMGVDAVLNTHGLEKTFPGLADKDKKAEFQKFIDGWKATVKNATADNEEDLIDQLLSDDQKGLLSANARTVQLPDEVLISEFADGAFSGLDPFSSMIWPGDVPEFTKATQGQFSGIGIQIQPDDNGDLKVVRPLPGGPAKRAGIKRDDVIVKINGKSAKRITSDEAVRNITGPSGTTVDLTVRRPDGSTLECTVRRERVKVESVEGYNRNADDSWEYYIDPTNKIAYLRITQFSGFTVEEMKNALNLVGAKSNGVIIDLRGNPGGLLSAAIGVCDQFLKSGVIVSTHPDRETSNPPTEADAKDDGNEFTKPLVVLVNQYSASASEIVSGALKDDHRAILVGQRTYGKGSVQQIFSLDDQKAILKLTTAHYYLPSGRCIHREENSTEWGVDPDVTVEMTPEQMVAAQKARLAMELGSDIHATPAEGQDVKIKQINSEVNKAMPEGNESTTKPTTQAVAAATATTKPVIEKTLLEADPQLAAGLLVLRLQITGAKL